MARILGILLPLLASVGAWAQGPADSWDNLMQLRVGQKIEVVDMNLKSLKGTLLSLSEEAVSLQVGENEVAVQRPDVLRVSSRENPKRGRNALIGLALGAMLGAGVAGCSFESPCKWPPSRESAIGAGAGAAAGALVGAVVAGHQTIYRAPKPHP